MSSKKKVIRTAAAETSAAAVAEQTAETSAAVAKIGIVICAYPGTEEKMERLWKKALGDGVQFIVIKTGPAVSGQTPDDTIAEEIQSLAECAVSDNRIADDFVLVPANTFPVCRVSAAELEMPVVYVEKNGRMHYAHKLPQRHSKDTLVNLLAEKDFWGEEDFAASAFKASGLRAVEVGHSFGNYVTNVNRATPCENVVIEAFVRKKYISTSPEGWKAIEHLVDRLLAE